MEKRLPIMSSSSSGSDSEDVDELRYLVLAPPLKHRRLLSKQLSMRETTREAAWERRRKQILKKQRSRFEVDGCQSASLTDEDLDELKGSIELGFGFNEEDGQELCNTLPALDFYFAVNRQVSDPKFRFSSPSPASSPQSGSSPSAGDRSSSSSSPQSHNPGDQWKIFSPGDNPQHVKTRLRHWALAVACSMRQCS